MAGQLQRLAVLSTLVAGVAIGLLFAEFVNFGPAPSAPAPARDPAPERVPPSLDEMQAVNQELRVKISGLKRRVAELQALVTDDPALPDATESGEVANELEKSRNQWISWVQAPLQLKDRSAEEAGRAAFQAGEVQRLATALGDGDFIEFMRSNVAIRIERMERSAGRPLSASEKDQIERSYVNHWQEFREWRRSEFLTAVRAAQSAEELQAAIQLHTSKRHNVYSSIANDITSLFRDDPRHREIVDAVLQHL